MKMFQLDSTTLINLAHITSIESCKGSECNAPDNERNEEFLAVMMANGRFYRLKSHFPVTSQLLKALKND